MIRVMKNWQYIAGSIFFRSIALVAVGALLGGLVGEWIGAGIAFAIFGAIAGCICARLHEAHKEFLLSDEKQAMGEVGHPSLSPQSDIRESPPIVPPVPKLQKIRKDTPPSRKPQCPKCGRSMTVFFNTALQAQDALCLSCEGALLDRAREMGALNSSKDFSAQKDSAGDEGVQEHVIGYEGAIMRSPVPAPKSESDWDFAPPRRTPARW